MRCLHLASTSIRRLPWNYCEGKVLDKISVHYNIGHLMTMEGDTMDPKALPGGAEQADDRPLHAGGPAAAAEPPADRHQQRQDATPHDICRWAAALRGAIEASKLAGRRYKVGTDSRTDKPHPGAFVRARK